MPSASDYLATETTKRMGKVLEIMDGLKEDIEKCDPSELAGLDENMLVTLHETFGSMETAFGQFRLVTMVARALTNKTEAP